MLENAKLFLPNTLCHGAHLHAAGPHLVMSPKGVQVAQELIPACVTWQFAFGAAISLNM